MEFDEALARFGFTLTDDRASRGARLYEARPNRFLTYSVHAFDDGSALFTWEFAIIDYLAGRGIQLGSGEALNTFMYPAADEQGRQDGAWLVSAVDRTEATLKSLDFGDPER